MPRLAPLLLLPLAVALLPTASADEETKPPRITSLEAVAALDPSLPALRIRYRRGMLAALAERCPKLERLEVEEHGKIPLDDLKALARLPKLTSLNIWGDLSFPVSHFEVVGALTQMEHLQLGLG